MTITIWDLFTLSEIFWGLVGLYVFGMVVATIFDYLIAEELEYMRYAKQIKFEEK